MIKADSVNKIQCCTLILLAAIPRWLTGQGGWADAAGLSCRRRHLAAEEQGKQKDAPRLSLLHEACAGSGEGGSHQ